jgi:hypothetical protein
MKECIECGKPSIGEHYFNDTWYPLCLKCSSGYTIEVYRPYKLNTDQLLTTKKKESTEQTDFSIELHEFFYLFVVSRFGGYVLKEDVTKEQLLAQLDKLVKAAKEI